MSEVDGGGARDVGCTVKTFFAVLQACGILTVLSKCEHCIFYFVIAEQYTQVLTTPLKGYCVPALFFAKQQ